MKKPQGPRNVNSKVAPKLERIYRILLDLPLRKWSIYGLSKEAWTDYHWTYNIYKDLEKKGLVRDGVVIEPELLFNTWKVRPSGSLFREYHIQDPINWVRDTSLDYAATTYYAENRLGQYLLPKSLDIYIRRSDADQWHKDVIKVGYAGKGNLRLILADEHVFWNRGSMEGLKIVCVQQLIVDLLREGGICVEAAENLRDRYYDKK